MTSYSAAHHSLRQKRGDARDFGCLSCGNEAAEWAYDHSDPNELSSRYGPYSLDVSRYNPLCVPCHRSLDGKGKTHCIKGHEFTVENTYLVLSRERPYRECRECIRDRVRRYKARKRVQP